MTEVEAPAGVQDQATKMKASEFHLSWNNYEASLASFLRLLSSAKEGEEALSDVTISCSGGKLFQVSHPIPLESLMLHVTHPRPTVSCSPPAPRISGLCLWGGPGPGPGAPPTPSSTSPT